MKSTCARVFVRAFDEPDSPKPHKRRSAKLIEPNIDLGLQNINDERRQTNNIYVIEVCKNAFRSDPKGICGAIAISDAYIDRQAREMLFSIIQTM